MTTDASRMRVEIGIADIDSYSMLFYGHYLRFNERAANLCLGAESASATLSAIAMSTYKSSVRWNDEVYIRTTLVPRDDAAVPSDEHGLLHEWLVGEKLVHSCLCRYRVQGPVGFTGAHAPDDREKRKLLAQQRGSNVLFSAQEGLRETGVVFPDMISASGTLAIPCLMGAGRKSCAHAATCTLTCGLTLATTGGGRPLRAPAHQAHRRAGGARAAQGRRRDDDRRLLDPAARAAAHADQAARHDRGGLGLHD